MPFVCTLAAYSGTGKTTYLTKLLPCLKARGIRVGVIKHDVHSICLDAEGKDTQHLAEAGADRTAIGSADGYALWVQRPAPLAELLEYFSDMDLVLTEGYKQEGYPKIALYRHDSGKGLAVPASECWAIVSDTPLPAPCPVFPLDDAEPLAEYLCRALREGS